MKTKLIMFILSTFVLGIVITFFSITSIPLVAVGDPVWPPNYPYYIPLLQPCSINKYDEIIYIQICNFGGNENCIFTGRCAIYFI